MQVSSGDVQVQVDDGGDDATADKAAVAVVVDLTDRSERFFVMDGRRKTMVKTQPELKKRMPLLAA